MLNSAVANRAASLIRVQPGEGRPVIVMLVYSAAAVGGVLTIGFNGVGEALFLSRLPASDVPLTFILPAISIVLTLSLYNRLAVRVPLPYLAAGTSALLVCVGIGFRFLLAGGYGRSLPVLAGIFLYCETAASISIMQFWTCAGQIFHVRQARRLFGLIAAGGTLSGVAAGLSLSALVRFIGVENLLLVVAGSLGVCGVCSMVLRRQVRESLHRPGATPPAGGLARRGTLFHDLAALWRVPLLRAIAGLTVLVSLLINIGAYQFFLALQITYAGRGESLAVFLGAFAFWTGLAALAVQLFGTSSVMTRFGIFAAQLFFPLAMAVSGLTVLLAGGALGAVSVSRACDPVFRRTTHEASFNTLFLPIEPALRHRARSLLEALYAATFGLAGLVFLLVQGVPFWTYEYWSIPVLLLATCWGILLVWARRQYVLAVSECVNRRRLDFASLAIDVADETTMGVLVQALQSQDDRAAVHVLHLIGDAPGTEWLPHVAAALRHPSVQVQVMALRTLERVGDRRYSDDIVPLLDSDSDDVRGAAIGAICAASPDALSTVVSLLDDPGPRTAGAAVVCLLQHGDIDHAPQAAERLKAMLTSDRRTDRQEAARVLGSLAGHALPNSALWILDGPRHRSENPPAGESTPVAHLIRLLPDGATSAVAADGLVHHGAGSLPALEAALSDRTGNRVTRVMAADILRRIGTGQAGKILLDHLPENDEAVRAAIYRGLAEVRTSGVDIPVDHTVVRSQVMAELWECYKLSVWQRDLSLDDGDALLRDAVRQRTDRAFDRVFSLLEVAYPGHGIARTRRALSAGDGDARAMATEMIDSVIEHRIRALLLPLVEAPVERVVEIARTRLGIVPKPRLQRLAELADHPDSWLRACALARIGSSRDPRLAPLTMAALESDDALVRETALAACKDLVDVRRLTTILTDQASAAGFPLVRRYARALLQDMAEA